MPNEPISDDEAKRRTRLHAPLPTGGLSVAAAAAPAPAPEAPKRQARDEGDPRERAARRAAELREHGDLTDTTDKFYIDPAIIPDGWSYEWKMWSVLGKEDPSYQVELGRKGWEPVPVTRHPEMMPSNWAGMTIDREGQRLMERPLVITQEAKARDDFNARQQVRAKEEQVQGAPAGQNSPFDPTNKGKQLNSISKSYEAMEIPK